MITINFKNKKRIVAVDGKKQIGYLTFGYADDASENRNINMHFLWIRPEYRRQGIGTKMINYLIDNSPDVTWFSFWTGKDIEKESGTAFHDKLGFTKLAYQEDYYEPGVGTTLFVKRNKTK